MILKHTFREGNKVADFIANRVFFFASIDRLTYSTFQELPKEAKALVNVDKMQVPNLRIRNMQNEDHQTDKAILSKVLNFNMSNI